MGIRVIQQMLMQVDAIERRQIAYTARAVNIGMAGGANYHQAIRDLELTQSKQDNTDSAWAMLNAMGGG